MRKTLAIILTLSLLMAGAAIAEEEEEYVELELLRVTAHQLNGRARPDKKSTVEVQFDYDDEVFPTGKWSADHKWVEVFGGEGGTVWCSVNYLTERKDVFTVYSLNPGKIRIRKYPGAGKVTGSVRKGQKLEIMQVVMGYGKCKRGWVDLSYFIEEEE